MADPALVIACHEEEKEPLAWLYLVLHEGDRSSAANDGGAAGDRFMIDTGQLWQGPHQSLHFG